MQNGSADFLILEFGKDVYSSLVSKMNWLDCVPFPRMVSFLMHRPKSGKLQMFGLNPMHAAAALRLHWFENANTSVECVVRMKYD